MTIYYDLMMKYLSMNLDELIELYTDLGAMGPNMDCTKTEFYAIADAVELRQKWELEEERLEDMNPDDAFI